MLCYKDNFMSTFSAFSPYRLMRRETGFGTPVGNDDAIARSLYCGMKPIASWDSDQANVLPTGGVFNLEFSPEGSLLVAACEKQSIQIFDPLTHKRVHHVNGAHSDFVNCVKFLDSRMFATCSDDTTIALWDVRYLKKKMRSLHGHSNWVKNIEFSVKDQLLVSSGLDGSIYTWDINSYTEYNLVYQRVFHASGLMRCRLSPDAKQMVMCTTGGLLVIIHNLNLSTLASCLHGFKPNLYRLMQMSRQLIPIAAMYDHLFDPKREENRVEFVSDFPEGNDAEIVSSLQIHPQGWSALSRNISHGDRSEWSCIHDIQPWGRGGDKSTREGSPPPPPRRPRRPPRVRSRPYRPPRPQTSVTPATPIIPHAAEPSASSSSASVAGSSRGAGSSNAGGGSSGGGSSGGGSEEAGSEGGGARVSGSQRLRPALTFSPAARTGVAVQNDVWEASVPIKQHRMLQDMYNRGQVGRNINVQRITGITSGIPPPRPREPRPQRRPVHSNSPSTSGHTPEASTSDSSKDDDTTTEHIRQNRDRLLYYIEETNEGRGFIKELCYSADGRIVCSPFGRGMRLLALNDKCSELSHCDQHIPAPQQMVEIGQSLGIHRDLVVSSKFSPRHHLLVTGCLEGKIVWYEPYSGESLY